MTGNLRDQLQATLTGSYTLERELGGGGMSRVFVADELRLKRKVVVKVLSPELAQGISVERFEREIQTVAALQHANIVPVHTAGDTNGLPFYTMPFVEGESLRARLARGPLAVTEVIGILRDVTRALAYAHQRGVVHRDIKPDNVLISGGAAVVTDFGIAKAISASRTASSGATLTQIGTSIGTPAYMAPEQAAGDPDIDHRADIYSLGAMAYELLSGQAVFANRTPQRMLAAHMGEAPKPITEFRGDLPAPLTDLVMQCLAKDAKDRPQSAGDIARVLDTITSGSGMQAMPPVLLGGPAMFRKALAVYAAAFVAVAILAKAAIVGIGLPDWVFPGSLIVMALGLPVVLWTGYVQRVTRRAMTATPTYTPGGSPSTTAHGTIATMALKAAPHVSWYQTARGGIYALGAFIAVIVAFMAMRALGIGPAGTLLTSGVLNANEPILIADFDSPANDTTLGAVITEALRTDLSQSKSIVPVQPTAVRDILRRMQRPVNMRLDFALARELAAREGIKAIIAGDVAAVGAGFLLSARLVSTQSGDVLAAYRQQASGPNDVIPAIDKLSRSLRGKIGESLKSVQATPPLYRVTTGSLEALRKFTQGSRAIDVDGDNVRGLQLVQEAIALDTGFAAAYRKVAVTLRNQRVQLTKQREYFAKAFAHRDRLSDLERANAEGNYYGNRWTYDEGKMIAAYEALIEAGGRSAGHNGLGLAYTARREYAKAEGEFRKAIEADTLLSFPYTNLQYPVASQGRWKEVAAAVENYARHFPRRRDPGLYRALGYYVNGLPDSVRVIYEREVRAGPLDPVLGQRWAAAVRDVEQSRGRLRSAERYRAVAAQSSAQMGDRARPLTDVADRAQLDAWFLRDNAGAIRRLDSALARGALDSLPEDDRPYLALAQAYAQAGRADKARALVARFDRAIPHAADPGDVASRSMVSGLVAESERRHADALRDFRSADVGGCAPCALPAIARALDLGGQPDSAIAVYERFLTTPELFFRTELDAWFAAPTRLRLGELYEQKGNAAKAAEHYRAFIDLWKDADPELQPKVAEARRRLARLTPVEKPR